jgi:hypothetical protein
MKTTDKKLQDLEPDPLVRVRNRGSGSGDPYQNVTDPQTLQRSRAKKKIKPVSDHRNYFCLNA